MLQKLALAVKTKTIEFFAEEEEDDDRSSIAELCLDANEEIITGQRVVVIKPDKPSEPNQPLPCSSSSISSPSQPQSCRLSTQSLASSLFATISAFHAAYLQLQTAHDPFNQDAIETADRAAVSHLQRLIELRNTYFDRPKDLNWDALPSELEALVLENQSLLRKYETVFNRLQAGVDCKDAEVGALRQQLKEIEGGNALLKKRLEKSGVVGELNGRDRVFLTIGVFDSVLKECCRMVHRFTKVLISVMKCSGWDLGLAANAIHPNMDYAKKGHCKYAILSYICLGIFEGFGSRDFGGVCDEVGSIKLEASRGDYLSQFVRQLTIDSMELLDAEPDCEFARFCAKKYEKIIHPKMRASLVGNLEWRDTGEGSGECCNWLYEPFVLMSNMVWTLHKLSLAFDLPVEIFRVAQGADFSIIYMDSVIRGVSSGGTGGKDRRTVGFTVIPGFYIGNMVIQCKVYLDRMSPPL